MDRLVALQGAMNFRDLGGYRSADGGTVRWGCVYRSDALDQLTDADVEVLAERDIRLVCDLRSDREVTEAPSRLPDHPDLRRLRFPIGGDTGESTSILELILAGDIREFGAPAMADLYMSVLEAAAGTFAEVVRLAADPANHPMVFHCTAGKDRTGVAAALLLGVLRIGDEDLLDDYELTAIHRSERRIEALRPSLEAAGVDIDAVRAYLSAERPVLAATLDQLRARWGSPEAYLLDVGGLTRVELARARDTLLEP
ncbi:MAG TPA: tyrosine-protein phosphatase [Acidimicrobiales bacterium]|nr:tyrosine-protein phosphatase [Acidimicrobiales bacterium]